MTRPRSRRILRRANISNRYPVSAAPTRRTLFAYGSLAFPLSLAEIPLVLYLPAFYARELGLSAGLVGLVFLSARLWDGLSDVLIGWLSDRSMSRFGRRKPWVIAGVPFVMVSAWFLCNPPQSAGLIYLGVWVGLFYTAITAVKVPYLSWGTELSADYVERSRVATFREAFPMLGNLFFVSAPLLFLPDDAPLRDVLFMMSATVLVVTPFAAALLGKLVHDPAQTERTQTHLFKGLAALAKDRILIGFAVAMLFIMMANGVLNALVVFSFSVGLQLHNKFFVVVFILYVAMLCALPFAKGLSRRAEKHRLMAFWLAVRIVTVSCLLVAPAGNFPLIAALWIPVGIANASLFTLPSSMLADIIDHGEVATGERRSGAYVAVFNLAAKIGVAMGIGLSFGLLELVDYDPSAAVHSAADALNIRLLGFGLPCLLLILPMVLMLKYPITRKLQQELREKIDARAGVKRAQ